MSRFKISLVFIILLLALIGVALLPLLFTHIQDERILDRIYIEKMEDENNDDYENINTIDKLQLIIKSYEKESNVIVRQEQVFYSREFDNEVVPRIIDELKKIREIGVIPEIDLDINNLEYRSSRITFADIDNPQNLVSLWEINFYNDNYSINISIDTKTNVIYSINFKDYEEIYKIDQIKTLEAFASYLGIEWDRGVLDYYGSRIYREKMGRFSYECMYREGFLYLFLQNKSIE
ncbi:hypothetical protein SH1V18_21390 [Vallitalea longa]|uniref:Uncharacterized protein n=1 Tax=Vallitalea longa TaxID=2936439 RepID=A0A9W6DGE7_9FIRM|nr:hypothetical protein [Vallitalea longa]GKX29659.1 hypothetical protein SH1V18_21390 [Vallitalea longa]